MLRRPARRPWPVPEQGTLPDQPHVAHWAALAWFLSLHVGPTVARCRSIPPVLKGRKHMAQDNHYDVIIIGTGAGGGTLAYHLAPSGKRILLLERGDFLPRELQNWDAEAV